MAPLPVSCAAELPVALDPDSVELGRVFVVLPVARLLPSALVLRSVGPVALLAVETVDPAADVVVAVLVEFAPPERFGRSNSTPYAIQIALEPSAVTADRCQCIVIGYHIQAQASPQSKF